MSEFVDKLRAIVGDKGLITDEQTKHPYVTDWRENYLGTALAVVRPASTEEVAAVVKLCAAEKVAIVPQGGNTGLVGGGMPHETGREIVLSLTRMNRIVEVDTIGYSMTVESGVVLKTIQETAAAHDRLFPLSLAAEGSCTIGGNLSTNAGGVQVLHYGNARHLVLGLEVVTPAGDIWNGLRALKKDNTGYDLRDLYLGAEGTLGIITKAVLKLWPKPKDIATSWIAVPSPDAAVALLSGAHAASEDNVTSCELMARQGLDFVLKHIPGSVDPLTEIHDWYVLLEWSSTRARREGGNEGGLREKMEAYLGEAMEKGLVLDAAIAQNEAQARALWALRENHAEAQKKEGPSIKHDISVAVSKLPAFMKEGLAAMKKSLPDCRPVPFGHVGDGNLHFNCQSPPGWDKPSFMKYGEAISGAVYDLVVGYGGSISAEHGIGQLKLEDLAHYRSKVELDVMRSVKRALDPHNIMNPGKVIQV
ncbi:FAD/FMN-containing dehydrogenase [Enhydrobacter aerosaccus]|uniref:FAD/FMN-containing dehydrogenase n=1 Tax=Enhydrobacter aerosaccus TaxID=225324 RepID=A0A1T4RVK3_9HYPH|nr:FAD-binding oxidoreductase [Enhydrobacter aerosaccus]SKA20029.1 FAD/FMN-containing dehydrogenase [Enhydrobacter aerosaccus]